MVLQRQSKVAASPERLFQEDKIFLRTSYSLMESEFNCLLKDRISMYGISRESANCTQLLKKRVSSRNMCKMGDILTAESADIVVRQRRKLCISFFAPVNRNTDR